MSSTPPGPPACPARATLGCRNCRALRLPGGRSFRMYAYCTMVEEEIWLANWRPAEAARSRKECRARCWASKRCYILLVEPVTSTWGEETAGQFRGWFSGGHTEQLTTSQGLERTRRQRLTRGDGTRSQLQRRGHPGTPRGRRRSPPSLRRGQGLLALWRGQRRGQGWGRRRGPAARWGRGGTHRHGLPTVLLGQIICLCIVYK